MAGNQVTIPALRRLDGKVDSINDELNDLTRAQAAGENPDPAEFMQLMEKRLNTQQAMQAQYKLNDKPLKTVLNESR